jgi:hypothetical protein
MAPRGCYHRVCRLGVPAPMPTPGLADASACANSHPGDVADAASCAFARLGVRIASNLPGRPALMEASARNCDAPHSPGPQGWRAGSLSVGCWSSDALLGSRRPGGPRHRIWDGCPLAGRAGRPRPFALRRQAADERRRGNPPADGTANTTDHSNGRENHGRAPRLFRPLSTPCGPRRKEAHRHLTRQDRYQSLCHDRGWRRQDRLSDLRRETGPFSDSRDPNDQRPDLPPRRQGGHGRRSRPAVHR